MVKSSPLDLNTAIGIQIRMVNISNVDAHIAPKKQTAYAKGR